MKIYHNHIIKIALATAVIFSVASCRKNFYPSDRVEDSGLLNTIEGMRTATLGNYATLKGLN